MSEKVRVSRFKLSGVGSFADDIARERQLAIAAGDDAAAKRLTSLWLDYLEVQLPAKGTEYIENRKMWRPEGGWRVIKTVDTPCIAFTFGWAGELLELIGIAACYRYPAGGEEAWWQQDVRPRVQRL